ncbi:hypothetical protein QVD17_14654 [Tagetes erecta]|uniref:GATA transcription factor n=1 Tax=Tagetes erecta TaxID=13708 RepID=A0AAD8NYU9_TARER|nr:hypothetical protein QVD17_14654 [Tagetes erecta]
MEQRPASTHLDHFIIDDLLNFPTDDTLPPDHDLQLAHSTDSSTTTTAPLHTCNSDLPPQDTTHFSNDLSVPYDDMAELEWLSNFVEDSFSSEDMEKLQLISGVKPQTGGDAYKFHHNMTPKFNNDMMVQGKARTKRSRAPPCDWSSRLVAAIPQPYAAPTTAISSEESEESDITSTSIGKKPPTKKKEVYDGESHNGEGRKCLHCATDKTPQWRTGPLGPKTLCNACGVRYKSGRLVPEYRPASSPTFVLTKHSNSHRKVLELRRQKEMQSAHPQPAFFHHHQNMMFDVPKGDDYLIHQHIGPDFRQLI